MASNFKGWGASWGDSWGAGGSPSTVLLQGTGAFGLAGYGDLTLVFTQPPPTNGPSGGANWTRGYKPTHDYLKQRRRSRRDEILFLRG
jgi:hypothetical protein